jgi:hypothetical protein
MWGELLRSGTRRVVNPTLPPERGKIIRPKRTVQDDGAGVGAALPGDAAADVAVPRGREPLRPA